MQIARYILGILCCAVLCGIVQMLFEKHSSLSQLIKLVTGLIMVIAVIQPLCKIQLPSVEDYFSGITDDGSAAAEAGILQSQEYLRESIKQRTQTYILDKAAALGVDITVDVSLSEDIPPYPISAVIVGTVSPYARKQLSHYLKTELNISEENQRWI